MQKIKNPILCWIVILAVFIRPTPAQAMVPLAVVAVGGIIAATGVMVAGAGVYKPPTFAQANAAVDSVTGDITRKVVVARAFAEGLNTGLRGFQSQYTLDFSKAAEWIDSHTPDFPVLAPIVAASTTPVSLPPAVGRVFPFNSSNYKITGISLIERSEWGTSSSAATGVDFGYPTSLGGGCWLDSSGTRIMSDIVFNRLDGSIYRYLVTVTFFTSVLTTDDLTPIPPGVRNPSSFAAAYPNTQAGQDETDKIAADYPAAIKSEPQEMTPDQINEAMKQIQAEMSDATADAAEAAAAADPTNTALQIAAEQARLEANKDAVIAEAERAQAEVKPEEKTDTPPPSGPALDQDLQIDLSPFLGLKDKAMGKFPFSAVSSLGSIFSGLTADPVTPSMDMPMPWGLPPAKISLSKWDDFAVKWRFLIAMMFHASCIYAIVRRYS